MSCKKNNKIRRRLGAKAVLMLIGFAFTLVVSAIPQSAHAADLPTPWACYEVASIRCITFSGYSGAPGAYGSNRWWTPVTPNGNNCTNYVAYRLNAAGYEYYIAGNARDYVEFAKSNPEFGLRVSSQPGTNSVAAWPSRNHVGWVDKVIRSTDGTIQSILISESAWRDDNDDYSRRREIPVGSADWPDAFIAVDGITESNAPAQTSSAIGSNNLVPNGGFESGAWAASGPVTWVSLMNNGSAYSGQQYLAAATSPAGGSVFQDIPVNVQPGQVFCGSAAVRSKAGQSGASGSFVVWLLGGSYNENGQRAFSGLSNSWTRVDTCVSATTAHSVMRVEFYPTAGSGKTVDIDDVDVH